MKKPMNKITQEKIALAINNALDDEDLYYKEAADILQISRNYFSLLKNDKYWDKISQEAWKAFQTWMYSGKKLKEFRRSVDPQPVPVEQEDPEPDIDKFRRELYSNPIIKIKNPGVKGNPNPDLIQKLVLEIEVSLKIKKD